jgi:DNA ligase 1
MKLPILYKRAKTGKIVSYKILVAHDMVESFIQKETRQIDGKKITHTTSVLAGKQNRTREEQAEFMAKSDWKSKQDQGYKTLEQLGFGLPEEAFLSCTIEEQVKQLDAILPKDNTDSSGNIKPMLAHEAKKHIKKVKFPCYVQPKLDGVRCLAIVGQSDESLDTKSVELLSRSGKAYNVPHIQKALLNLPIGIYDGEIYTDKLSFQDLVSAVKATKETSKLLEYHIYDIVNNKSFKERSADLYDYLGAGTNCLKYVETLSVHKENEIKELHDVWVSQGYEGLMIRQTEGLYEHSRSYNLLKYKEFDDAEFKLLSWEKGEREEDLIAVCEMPNGKQFKAKMMGTKEQKLELENYLIKDYSLLTVKFFGLTDDGIPRFPIGKAIKK